MTRWRGVVFNYPCAHRWNANGKDVTKLNLDLEPWLRSRSAPADVYAIGAQEMVDLTVSNVAVGL